MKGKKSRGAMEVGADRHLLKHLKSILKLEIFIYGTFVNIAKSEIYLRTTGKNIGLVKK